MTGARNRQVYNCVWGIFIHELFIGRRCRRLGIFLTGNIISWGWMRGDTLDYAFCRAGAIGTRVTLLHEWIRLKSSAVCQISKPERTAADSLSLHIRGHGAFSAGATKSRGAWENGN